MVKTKTGLHLGLKGKIFFSSFYFYIYFSDLQESVGGAIHKASNYPRPGSGDAKILLSGGNFLFFFYIYKNMIEIQNWLLRPPSRVKYRKVFSNDKTE